MSIAVSGGGDPRRAIAIRKRVERLLNDGEYQGRLARAISAGVATFLTQIEARDGKK